MVFESVKHLEERHISYHWLFEFLDKQIDSHADICSEILLTSLESDTPYLGARDLNIFRKVYHQSSRGKEVVEQISEIYLEKQDSTIYRLLQELKGDTGST